ncbi:MAG: SUMF1/EgtB/PvdO family nonheme iron enzyme [Bryobacteraceae bacterium]|jgi:gamma-glutamyl hercynylcysteine S-oxide synthase
MRTQTELGRVLDETRERTDALFGIVRPDSLYERPIPERHRIIFYLGHLEAFDWNLIGRYALDRRPFHPEFDKLFAFGIDPPPGQLPGDKPSDWPTVKEVEAYNRRTRDAIDDLIDEVPEQLLHVAIEHRLMHVETLAYILHQLPYDRKIAPAAEESAEAVAAREHWMIDIPRGAAQLGLKDDGFGWDNEFDAHEVDVPAFSIAKHKVTNGEYLEFVRQGAPAPFFWVQRGGEWSQRGMFAEFPLPLDWPVYATYEQAQAYAKKRGAALPTEPQFHRAACLASGAGHNGHGGNLDFRRWDPVPVQADDSAAAVPSQLVGNGWEWTSTAFAPFPGFTPFPFYQNYSAPFFDGQHYVLKGASPVTAARLARPSFRNWFRPSYPYVYATFRLVEP